MISIPPSEFAPLLDNLTAYPLPMNRYRTTAGEGRSQVFGIVNKRSAGPPDYSRQCWLRPVTYSLLLDFADKWIDISWNAITVNVNYRAAPHRDRGNRGLSTLVAFGDFTGGELEFHEGDLSGTHDVRYKPLTHDFSKDVHSVTRFQGQRMSLVFYWCHTRGVSHPPPSVRDEDGTLVFYRGEERITKANGLPHPLRKPKLGDIGSGGV
jgi:hypothetical protein